MPLGDGKIRRPRRRCASRRSRCCLPSSGRLLRSSVATLTTSVAFAATFTRITINGNAPPGASASLRVQVTSLRGDRACPAGSGRGRRRQASREVVGHGDEPGRRRLAGVGDAQAVRGALLTLREVAVVLLRQGQIGLAGGRNGHGVARDVVIRRRVAAAADGRFVHRGRRIRPRRPPESGSRDSSAPEPGRQSANRSPSPRRWRSSNPVRRRRPGPGRRATCPSR